MRLLHYFGLRNKRKNILTVVQLSVAVLCTVYLVMLFFGEKLTLLPEDMGLGSPKLKSKHRTKSPKLRETLQYREDNRTLCPSGGVLMYGKYCALQYWAVSARTKSEDDIVTLCTQGTPEFLYHVSALCDRWHGPISVAVFCADEVCFLNATKSIMALRYCHTCIGDWVDWHLFYDLSVTKPPLNFQALMNISEIINCNMKKLSHSSPRKRNGSYPINVGRNLARSMAGTPYVLSIDIELYPSSNLRVRFQSMIQSQDKLTGTQKKEVWVLPVFEVWTKLPAPRTKAELQAMYKKKFAISFHKYRCNVCHEIPNLKQWMNTSSVSNGISVAEQLSRHSPLRVFSTVKRNKKFKLTYWEPFFIGTKHDPEFDPRLSWEGKMNKMQVALEMCLLDYDFHIILDAFLVHSPGINVFSPKKDMFRTPFVKKNNFAMRVIKANLTKKFGKKMSNC